MKLPSAIFFVVLTNVCSLVGHEQIAMEMSGLIGHSDFALAGFGLDVNVRISGLLGVVC